MTDLYVTSYVVSGNIYQYILMLMYFLFTSHNIANFLEFSSLICINHNYYTVINNCISSLDFSSIFGSDGRALYSLKNPGLIDTFIYNISM